MVIIGNISVRLVDGTTKQPFPEHTEHCGDSASNNSSIGNDNNSNNQGVIHYVEAEANTEFLIELGVTNNDENNSNNNNSNNNNNNNIYSFRSWVDGNSLGSLVTMRATHKNPIPIQRVGLFAIQKGVRSMSGIRWKKPHQEESATAVRLFQDDDSNDNTTTTANTGAKAAMEKRFLGSITVQVLEAIPAGMKVFRPNYEPAFQSKTTNKDSCTELGTTRELFASDEMISSPGTLWKRGERQGKRRAIVAATPPAKRHHQQQQQQQRHATFTTGALVQEITIHYTMASGPGDTGKQHPQDKSIGTTEYLEHNLCDKENICGSDDCIIATPTKPKATKRILTPVVDEETKWVAAPKEMILDDLAASNVSKETMTLPKKSNTSNLMTLPKESDTNNITPTSTTIKPVTVATATPKGSGTVATASNNTTIQSEATMCHANVGDNVFENENSNTGSPTQAPTTKLDVEAVDQGVAAMKGTERYTDSPTDTTCSPTGTSSDISITENSATESSSDQKTMKICTPIQRVVISSEAPAIDAPVPAKPKSRSNNLTDSTSSLSSGNSRISKAGDDTVTLQKTMVGTKPATKSMPCPQEAKEMINASPSKAKSHRVPVVKASPAMDETAITADSTPMRKSNSQEPTIASTNSLKANTKSVRVGGAIRITPRRSILLGGRGGKKKRKNKIKK